MADIGKQKVGSQVSQPLPSSVFITRRPLITNPTPVGVAGFALTTFTLGLYTSGWFNPAGALLVPFLALFYGGLTQFLAGWFAVARGDLFPGAFMTTYGAFWFTYAALILYIVPHVPPAAAVQMVTIYLVMWTIITFIYTVATLGTNWTVFITFLVFDVALVLVDVGSALGSNGATVTVAGGYAEMVLAALAWYIVMAEIVNETIGRMIFPLFPFKEPVTTETRESIERHEEFA
jgi:succinate-acetate transporter protein